MKTIKICVMALFFVLVVTMAQAQQSAFQGTWIGQDHRTGYRLDISENKWSLFYNNVIQAGGTAKFSSGQAQLVVYNS